MLNSIKSLFFFPLLSFVTHTHTKSEQHSTMKTNLHSFKTLDQLDSSRMHQFISKREPLEALEIIVINKRP